MADRRMTGGGAYRDGRLRGERLSGLEGRRGIQGGRMRGLGWCREGRGYP